MLKHIPPVLSPELVKKLMEMGHSDEIVLADANFPGHSLGVPVIRADGIGVPELLDAMCTLMPLDHYNPSQYFLMATVGDDPTPPIWSEYRRIVAQHDEDATGEEVERFAFYEQARSAALVVMTGETALYGNIILKKGVV
ncbi:MAG: RbsD/FucU domain-containing protein [Corynebacterium sp.]|uniref:RbsD/FucU family protein n=1 Tax=Corynebacterium sp. TaxID=1720 RepID=UPI0026DC3B4A|nr:RbsD/FucU domain-containing protein [Corynebacterium sp.]MDO5098118.1 RbsD/FucU domain-containing protein [Corynebacterium sp.]